MRVVANRGVARSGGGEWWEHALGAARNAGDERAELIQLKVHDVSVVNSQGLSSMEIIDTF